MSDELTEPQVVYHYTSIETMLKIVESKSIWATSICYLNDTSEGDHFLDLVKRRVPDFRRTHTVEDESVFDGGDEILRNDFRARPFIASFSTESDSLPQWRSYCPNGNGVAIGFSVDCLKRSSVDLSTPQAHLEFTKVEYVDGSETNSIDQAIVEAVNSATVLRTFASTQSQPDDIKSGAYFHFFLSRIASAKKHKSFSNEREYRLIFREMPHSGAIRFRPVRTTLVPYVPIQISPKRTGYIEPEDSHPVLSRGAAMLAGRWDFIDSVVIGPTPNKILSREALAAFFEKESMNVNVRVSEVPYRDL